MVREDERVLVVGAGPVGLICALGLARQGIPVTVFERHGAVQDDPRAATTHPATLEILEDLGLRREVEEAGLVARYFQFWDRQTGALTAQFDHDLLRDETAFPYVVQCEQFKTSRIALAHLLQFAHAEVRFGCEVVSLEHGVHSVTIDVASAVGRERHGGRYLIGADGGRSFVRKALGIQFEGFTWPERFVVLSTPFDFMAERGYSYRSYFADPEQWCNCFKVAGDGPPGLWRTVFPAEPGGEAELLSDPVVQARLQRFFPKTGSYDVVHRNIYQVHQRVAASFRKGRCLLAGDAAHVNNPIGGMGLNGGIQDAANLADKLGRLWRGEGGEELLDAYARQRRTITNDFVQAQTIQNKKRLEERDPATRARNLEDLARIAENPSAAKTFLMRTSMLDAQRRLSMPQGQEPKSA
ncbi:FAD-dependent oxidoreductase [Mesorhizobium sp. 1B3]|uniref:FAD-dependent oxidoreductase n=1 Tax=Mesorhizobium sp. 1B3 TaxID=3243599 RepID=UPI003D9910E9